LCSPNNLNAFDIIELRNVGVKIELRNAINISSNSLIVGGCNNSSDAGNIPVVSRMGKIEIGRNTT